MRFFTLIFGLLITVNSIFFHTLFPLVNPNYSLPEKPIVIVITSYNNARWYADNISSALNQNYTNYRILYFEDGSTDNTGEIVAEYLKKYDHAQRVTLIRNKTNKSQMANHYKAIHMCADHEIIVHLDGDDGLANVDVLKVINTIYSTSSTWLTTGVALEFPLPILWPKVKLSTFVEERIKNNDFRKEEWVYGHLRTFYAWLGKQVALRDCFYQGTFRGAASGPDALLMYPMLEMARTHYKGIDNVLYLWNKQNPISQYAISIPKIIELMIYLQYCEKYQELAHPKISPENLHSNCTTDIIYFCEHLTTETIEKLQHFKNRNRTFLFCHEDVKKINGFNHENKELHVIYYNQNTLSQKFNEILQNPSDYYIIARNLISISDTIDIQYCTQKLEKTFADVFYMDIAKDKLIPTLVSEIEDTILGWCVELQKPALDQSNIQLRRKKNLISYVNSKTYQTPAELFSMLTSSLPPRAIALSLQQPANVLD